MDKPLEGKTKLAIVGCTDSRALTPFDDPAFEVWGVNNLYPHIPRYDRWFEIHPLKKENGIWYRRGESDQDKGVFDWVTNFRGREVKDYLSDLAKLNVPVYMANPIEEIPLSVKYPLDEINETLKPYIQLSPYYTNTVSYEIALGICMGFKEIHVYGVDMAVGCLSPETRILTADLRWVPCSDLEVGDQIMGFDEEPFNGDGKTRRWRLATVTSNPLISKPCYRVYLEDGTEFIASENHGWLTHGMNMNRWKTTKDLVTRFHRHPTRIIKPLDVWETEDNWETGYIAAAFDGEGHFCQSPRKDHDGSFTCALGFAQRQNPMSETVKKILSNHGYDFSEARQNGGDTFQYHIRGGKPEIMKFLGQYRPQRLIANYNPRAIGELQTRNSVAVERIEFIGEQPVMGLETDTKTYIAEGFASHNSEYAYQRANCEFFLGIAMGMGIKVYVPPTSDLLKSRFLYAFEEKERGDWDKKVKGQIAALNTRMKQAQKSLKDKKQQREQYVGAIAAHKETLKCEGIPDEVRKKLEAEIGGMETRYANTEEEIKGFDNQVQQYIGAIACAQELDKCWQ